jgi:A/G-specific adenine glycosylase
MSDFARRLIAWQRRHGRHDLPWQENADPYAVWLSEIMLQQTQVATVVGYYGRFLARFPDLAALAAAPAEEVMALWSGLGYYARARNLHACARHLMLEHGGTFPRDPAALARLPGIGRSTANAIAAFCFGARVPILDGNVKRLLCRHRGIDGFPGIAAVESRLWRDAEALLPERDVAAYIQAQMDIGATVCTRGKPRCDACPVAGDCVALRDGRVAELPVPRPRKALPERAATLLVLRDRDRVLLETRPPAGIWGGLVSLPELPDGAEVAAHAERLGAQVLAVSPAPTFTHVFSHFRLRIHPMLCTVKPLPRAAEPGLRWVAVAALGRTPLPAPVRRILSANP